MEQFDFQIIANLLAGKGEAKKKLDEVEAFLKKNKKTFRSLKIIEPTPISKIPKDGKIHIREGVICIGGDGTVSETVGYVLNNRIEAPIAIVPTGTANIIATTLGIFKQNSFDFLINKKIKEVDIGVVEYVNEKDFFILGFGLGFEEKFLKLAKEKIKSRLGVFSYLLAAIAELLSLKRIPLKIESSDMQINTKACLLTIFNIHPIIFRYFPLFGDKKIKESDGVLNLYLVEYKNYPQALLGTLLFHILGNLDFGTVRKYSGKAFMIESPTVVGTQVDGELRSALPARVSIHSQKCRFMAP